MSVKRNVTVPVGRSGGTRVAGMALGLRSVSPQTDEIAVRIAEVSELTHPHRVGLRDDDLSSDTLDRRDGGVHVRGEEIGEDPIRGRRSRSGRLREAADAALDAVLAGAHVDVVGAGNRVEFPVEDRSVERLGPLHGSVFKDRKSTRLNSVTDVSRMPSSA